MSYADQVDKMPFPRPPTREEILEDVLQALMADTGLPRRVFLGDTDDLTPDELDHWRRANGLLPR